MKPLLLCLLLSGCAGAVPYLAQHEATIAIVGATAASTGAVLGAADNAVKLESDVRKEVKQ